MPQEPRIAAVAPKTLAQGLALDNNEIIVSPDLLDRGGNQLSMDTFGDIGYVTIDNRTTQFELCSFTGIDGNRLTGVVRGLKGVYPYDADPSLRKTHVSGAEISFTNAPQTYQDLIDYVNEIAFQGAPDATEAVKGIVQVADDTEFSDGEDTGSTGAQLVAKPSQIKQGLEQASTSSTVIVDDYPLFTGIEAGDPVMLNYNPFTWVEATSWGSSGDVGIYGIALNNATDSLPHRVQTQGQVKDFIYEANGSPVSGRAVIGYQAGTLVQANINYVGQNPGSTNLDFFKIMGALSSGVLHLSVPDDEKFISRQNRSYRWGADFSIPPDNLGYDDMINDDGLSNVYTAFSLFGIPMSRLRELRLIDRGKMKFDFLPGSPETLSISLDLYTDATTKDTEAGYFVDRASTGDCHVEIDFRVSLKDDGTFQNNRVSGSAKVFMASSTEVLPFAFDLGPTSDQLFGLTFANNDDIKHFEFYSYRHGRSNSDWASQGDEIDPTSP